MPQLEVLDKFIHLSDSEPNQSGRRDVLPSRRRLQVERDALPSRHSFAQYLQEGQGLPRSPADQRWMRRSLLLALTLLFNSLMDCAALNGQIAARKSGLHLMYTRPRQQMINDIVMKYLPEKVCSRAAQRFRQSMSIIVFTNPASAGTEREREKAMKAAKE